jgi:hypothetical protein
MAELVSRLSGVLEVSVRALSCKAKGGVAVACDKPRREREEREEKIWLLTGVCVVIK